MAHAAPAGETSIVVKMPNTLVERTAEYAIRQGTIPDALICTAVEEKLLAIDLEGELAEGYRANYETMLQNAELFEASQLELLKQPLD